MKLCIILCWLCCWAAYATAAKYVHSTLYTVTRVSCHPEFTALSFVNEQQITQYNSENKTLIPTHSWVRGAFNDYTWEKYKEIQLSEYMRLRDELNATMKSLGHVKDTHTFQRRSGCEWDDERSHTTGFDEYGYDGEDFISLNMTEMRYIPHTPNANSTAERWNRNNTLHQSLNHYINKECVTWLKRFGKENLEQTGNISFFQKTPFSPVICHISGFCPSVLKISWQKDGNEMKEKVSVGAVLPDGDGTYLRDISLVIDELDTSQFTCVTGNNFKNLNKADLQSKKDFDFTWIAVLVGVVGLFIVGLVVVLVSCWCRRNRGVRQTCPAFQSLPVHDL